MVKENNLIGDVMGRQGFNTTYQDQVGISVTDWSQSVTEIITALYHRLHQNALTEITLSLGPDPAIYDYQIHVSYMRELDEEENDYTEYISMIVTHSEADDHRQVEYTGPVSDPIDVRLNDHIQSFVQKVKEFTSIMNKEMVNVFKRPDVSVKIKEESSSEYNRVARSDEYYVTENTPMYSFEEFQKLVNKCFNKLRYNRDTDIIEICITSLDEAFKISIRMNAFADNGYLKIKVSSSTTTNVSGVAMNIESIHGTADEFIRVVDGMSMRKMIQTIYYMIRPSKLETVASVHYVNDSGELEASINKVDVDVLNKYEIDNLLAATINHAVSQVNDSVSTYKLYISFGDILPYVNINVAVEKDANVITRLITAQTSISGGTLSDFTTLSLGTFQDVLHGYGLSSGCMKLAEEFITNIIDNIVDLYQK